MSTVAAAVAELSPMFAGRLIQPGEAGYDTARKVHNGYIDKRPAVIAQCRGTADISDAVKLACRLGLEIAVKGGGHNVSGRATCDGGMMIDLSLMKSVAVDPKARMARVEGGATWRDFNREAQHYGLATPGGVVSSTGVAGLTLGGGLGWLMPKYGMALDNLLALTLVLADGQVVRASGDEHPDLFWAVRGGGGNFGVAAAFEFTLHPVGPMVTGGLVAHPLPAGRPALQFFRERTASVPDDMMMVAALLTAPDGSGHKIVGLAVGHFGTAAEAQAAVEPVKAFGPPVMDMIGPIPFTALNEMLDAAYPAGANNYWRSHFLATLPDAVIDALLDRAAKAPTPMCQIVLEHFHGVATRVPVEATAFALRHTGYNMLILGQWTDPADGDATIAWVRETSAAFRPFVGPVRYLNYLDHDESGDPAASAYGPNLAKLKQIKKKYDPANVFYLNVNIEP